MPNSPLASSIIGNVFGVNGNLSWSGISGDTQGSLMVTNVTLGYLGNALGGKLDQVFTSHIDGGVIINNFVGNTRGNIVSGLAGLLNTHFQDRIYHGSILKDD